MLTLVHKEKEKRELQSRLMRSLKKPLNNEGVKNIGFPSGNVDEIVYSFGKGRLWCAFSELSENVKIPRYWTPFGIYDPDRSSQVIVVEINVPTSRNSAQVAGFFARESKTGTIFLMHDGGIGGGQKGVGQSAFLLWSKAKLVDVVGECGKIRRGIAIAELGKPDLPERIWRFVQTVNKFKEAVKTGILDSGSFRQAAQEFERYHKEFSGTKTGSRGGMFEYLTYHGEIIQKLFNSRSEIARPDEKIFNTPMIDLCVKRRGIITEVYEVKTGLGRQALYTAIGQLLTHSASSNANALKILVLPANEEIPNDFKRAIHNLEINIRRFRLAGTTSERHIELLE